MLSFAKFRLKIDSMGLFCGTISTIRSKVGMIQQNYNMTDQVNYRADAKRFTHRRCKGAKNNMSKILV